MLALGFLPIAVADATRLERPLPFAIFLGLVCVAPILLLAWRPWVAWAASITTTWLVGTAVPVPGGTPWPWLVTFGLVLILTLVVVSIVCRVIVTLPVAAATSLMVGSMSAVDTQVGWAVGILLFATGGVLIHSWTQFRRQLERQEELSEVEKARRTVLEERARIARDLHDVVAHRMSLVVVAAETAPYRVADVSEPMRDELAAISATAREALEEMRGLLGVLRSADETPSYAPQPVLADLGTLVVGASKAGLPVSLRTTGTPRPLRSVVELSAYRIVQESLANAARHAPGAAVDVVVAFEPTHLRLAVTNGPPAGPADRRAAAPDPAGPPGHGHGLTGMAERAAVVGGTVRAGITPEGGFQVTAVLPSDEEPRP